MSRSALTLPPLLEALSDTTVRDALRALGERVREITGLGIQTARETGTLEPLVAAHTILLQVFEMESANYFRLSTDGQELLRSFACKPGCAFCCHLLVELTPLEAIAL